METLFLIIMVLSFVGPFILFAVILLFVKDCTKRFITKRKYNNRWYRIYYEYNIFVGRYFLILEFRTHNYIIFGLWDELNNNVTGNPYLKTKENREEEIDKVFETELKKY